MPDLPRIKGNTAYVHLYVCYQEVTQIRATRGDINQILGRINLTAILRIIALINNACTETTWPTHVNSPRFQARLEVALFDREWRTKICNSRWADSVTDCVIFHRQQQLLLLVLALENCPLEGGLTWDEEARHLYGIASLMANDLLSDRPLSTAEAGSRQRITPKQARQIRQALTDDSRWQARANTLATLEFNMDSSPRNAIGRAQCLWINLPDEPILRQRAGGDWLDWKTPFFNRYGVSLQDFLSITAAFWVYTTLANPGSAQADQHLIFDPYYPLNQTQISRGTIDRVLKILSKPASQLKDELPLKPPIRLGWDISDLKRTPLITFDEHVVVYDQTLLLKAATEGVYWLIQDSLPDSKAFGNMFGHVYERYTEQILRRIVPDAEPPALPRYHFSPYFAKTSRSKKDEVSDGLINCTPLLALVESKAVWLTTRAKYSGDGQALREAIDSKFAQKNGAKQLATSILRLAQGEKPIVRGYDAQSLRRIIPLIVSYDPAIATPLLCQYVNEVFQELLGKLPNARLRVGKVAILSTYDLECLESVCRQHPLSKVLTAYEKTCPIDFPFHYFLNGNYGECLNDGGDASVADAFSDTMQHIQQLLFGVSVPLAVQSTATE